MTETKTPPSNSTASHQAPAWDHERLANPHVVEDKADRVRQMFASIADSYDLNNRVHSMWRDQAWRRKAVKLSKVGPEDIVLDLACGTGDLSLAYLKPAPKQVIGLDFTHEMTRIAEWKKERTHQDDPVYFGDADATRLPLPNASVDVISIAFGIRNVQQPELAFQEFARVLKPGGRLMVLEFSLPRNFILRAGYQFFFRYIMPHTATWVSRDKSGAYKYLPESVNTFMTREKLIEMMTDAGFSSVKPHPLTFGIAIAYLGMK